MAFGWEPGSGFWISPKATSAVPTLAAVSQPIGVRSQHGAHVRVHPAPNTVTVSVALGGFPVENSRGPAPRGCACRGGGNLGTRLQPVLQPRARPTGEACPQVRREGCVRPGPLPDGAGGGQRSEHSLQARQLRQQVAPRLGRDQGFPTRLSRAASPKLSRDQSPSPAFLARP